MEKKYVYLFTEGNADMRELLGGKGANLAEMTRIGLPVPQGFTISTEACTRYYDDGKSDRRGHREADLRCSGQDRRRSSARSSAIENDPLAGFRPFRRPRFHARHDGHHPEPGPERRVREGPGQADRATSASPMTPIAVSSQMFSDVVMEIEKRKFEDVLDEFKEKRGVKFDTRPDRRRPEGSCGALQGHLQGRKGRGLPAGSQGTADGGRQGRVPFLGQPPRHRTTAA